MYLVCNDKFFSVISVENQRKNNQTSLGQEETFIGVCHCDIQNRIQVSRGQVTEIISSGLRSSHFGLCLLCYWLSLQLALGSSSGSRLISFLWPAVPEERTVSSLEQWFLTTDSFAFRRTLAMSAHILFVTTGCKTTGILAFSGFSPRVLLTIFKCTGQQP